MNKELLDYPGADIWLIVESEIEKTKRINACQKEPETVHFIESLPKGSVFYDIGANV